jgi:L-cysteine:1D-myo-inositol 2-amino-2-deoxy-alpha-D-glucopyranoside ligase
MSLRLYNSRTRRVEAFAPRNGQVSLYVCGITPYDVTHLGHAFTYTTFDVLRRYLELQGLTVVHVQNITDVDDDIIRKARELGTTTDELTARNVAAFERDMRVLGVLPPTVTPRASQEIAAMQGLIRDLLERGQAYVHGGEVFFDVSAFPDYGALSGLSPVEMLAENQRQRMRPGPHDPLDFILWQARAPGEPFWESPWGPGRPGWHIECTAMALRYAGAPVDIHGGGRDLIFPHHESEIAQAECATGVRPFARWWVHVGMIRYRGEKMSKSLGNLVLVQDLVQRHTPDAVRLSLLVIHYRSSAEWHEAAMAEADAQAALLAAAARAPGGRGRELDPAPIVARFRAALDDDLNTPAAVRVLLELAADIQASPDADLRAAQRELRTCAGVLGLRLNGDVES